MTGNEATVTPSHKQAAKISSLAGRLWEVVAYENLDYIGSKYCPISMCPSKALAASRKNQQLILGVLATWWPKVFSFCAYFQYVLLRLKLL